MGEHGKFLFLASQPLLAKSTDDVQTFNSTCSNVERTTSILGCYSDYKIYLFDVTDTKLDGVRETTAAHEMLHAAYLRMNDKDKTDVNKLLEAEADKLKANTDFNERMAYYDRNEPGQRDNELHSVIGTEIADISPDLETYYKKYFSDRRKVIILNAKYISVFQKISSRAKELNAELTALAENIKNNAAQYNADVQAVNSSITTFNSNASNGYFTSQSQFNAERANLTSQVSNLSQARAKINSDITKYGTLLDEYNSIASESKKLNNSLDSTLVPAPSV